MVVPVACINIEDNCDLVSFTSICSHFTFHFWDEVTANAVIIKYEVQYTSTDGSSVITNYTGSPPSVIEERNHGTNYTFSVTPFSLFSRGQSVERTVQTLSEPPRSQLVPRGNLLSLLLLLHRTCGIPPTSCKSCRE